MGWLKNEKYTTKSWKSRLFVDAKIETGPQEPASTQFLCWKQTEHLHGTPFRYFQGCIRTETQEAKHAHTQQKDSANQHDGVIGASTNPWQQP